MTLPPSSGQAESQRRIIARVVHDSAKPGRAAAAADSPYDQWVVHSTAEYAAEHLVGESLDDEAAVLAEMLAAFLGAADSDTEAAAAAAVLSSAVVHASVMAWDHAQTAKGSRVADAAYRIDTREKPRERHRSWPRNWANFSLIAVFSQACTGQRASLGPT
jgi:hypothetical protein